MRTNRLTASILATAMLGGLAGCDTGPKGQPKGAKVTLPKTLTPSETEAIDAAHLAIAQRDINDGLAFLLAARNDEGGWGFDPKVSDPALASMALKALLQHPDYDAATPVVTRALEILVGLQRPDGGFTATGGGNENYCTSVAVMAFVATKDPKYKPHLSRAIKFLRGQQILAGTKTPGTDTQPGRTIAENDPFAGGVSYGRHGRPDLSNVGMWMEALHEAGVEGDDPAMQRALAFVKRLQNRTEGTEGQVFVVAGSGDDGFIYAVRREGDRFVGESKADADDRGLRSYGSMTYIGFKSMLYANVARNDPRVRGAYEWIRKYWRLDSNPNMPEAMSKHGLFYYYHVFAKALRVWGQDVIPDARDIPHNWRHELIDVLHRQKGPDGSWVNPAHRWFEDNPTLVTCYAVLALQEAMRK